MTKKERILKALSLEEVDRVPVSAWMHFSEIDQDPITLAKTQVEFVKKYDYDFIKLMPFGLYSTQDFGNEVVFYCDKYKEPIVRNYAIESIEDYEKIKAVQGTFGTHGKQLRLVEEVSKRLGDDTPFVQTIFSPLSTLNKLSGGKVFEHLKTNPDVVHKALKEITKTTIDFCKENIKRGVSGFFMATQAANADLISLEDFRKFCTPYDLEVLNSYVNDTYLNIVHIHGSNIYFDEIAENYPINCINWHDRQTSPSLKEAREKYNICFLAGIREVPYFVDRVLKYDSIMANSTKEEIIKHCKEAIDQVNGRGLILGPGCVVDPKTKEENLYAISEAVK